MKKICKIVFLNLLFHLVVIYHLFFWTRLGSKSWPFLKQMPIMCLWKFRRSNIKFPRQKQYGFFCTKRLRLYRIHSKQRYYCYYTRYSKQSHEASWLLQLVLGLFFEFYPFQFPNKNLHITITSFSTQSHYWLLIEA